MHKACIRYRFMGLYLHTQAHIYLYGLVLAQQACAHIHKVFMHVGLHMHIHISFHIHAADL